MKNSNNSKKDSKLFQKFKEWIKNYWGLSLICLFVLAITIFIFYISYKEPDTSETKSCIEGLKLIFSTIFSAVLSVLITKGITDKNNEDNLKTVRKNHENELKNVRKNYKNQIKSVYRTVSNVSSCIEGSMKHYGKKGANAKELLEEITKNQLEHLGGCLEQLKELIDIKVDETTKHSGVDKISLSINVEQAKKSAKENEDIKIS